VGRHADIRDPSGRWATIYEVEADGAVLVRPDGHVAWRSRGGAMDSRQALECVLGRVLHGRL
jgi:hypothetical protein